MIRLSRDEFVDLVGRCYADLPPRILPYLENLDVVVEDWPSAEVMAQTQIERRGELLGLYTGVSRVERGGELPPLPDKITLFQRPIESICRSREEVDREVRKTLLHEVGHYLGMDEVELGQLGYS
ncbi:MAG: metallopeptidase family protein [Dehalococcoidia bacterium]